MIRMFAKRRGGPAHAGPLRRVRHTAYFINNIFFTDVKSPATIR